MPALRVVPEIRFKGFSAPWEHRELKDLCENFSYGLNAPAIEFNGKQKYLRITDIDDTNRRFKTDDLTSPGTTRNDLDNYALHEGDIVFARTGASVGKTYKYNKLDGNVYYAGFLIKAHVNKDNDVEFVFQNTLTKQYDNFVRLTSQRSGQPGVNANEYKTYKFSCTSLDEQTRIASVLRNIDNLINLHQCKCDSIKEIKQTLLEKMFPVKGESVPAIRFKGFTDDWEQRRLDEQASIVGGGTPDTNNPRYWDGSIDWYAPAEMDGVRYAFSSQRKITQEGLDNSSAKILPAERTILFTSRAGIGKVAILKRDAATNQGFQSLILHEGVDPYFVYSMGCFIKNEAEAIASGSTFLEISGRALGGLSFMFPSYMEQIKVSTVFQKLDNLITLHQRKCDMLKEIKQTLLSKMFV